MAWGAHDKIFALANDINQGMKKNQNPSTEEAFYSKAKQADPVAEPTPQVAESSIKNQRDADRAKMRAEI